jgi:hypothetical protein
MRRGHTKLRQTSRVSERNAFCHMGTQGIALGGSAAKELTGVLWQGRMGRWSCGEGEDAEEKRQADLVAATARAVSGQPPAPPRAVGPVAAPPDALPESTSFTAIKDKLEEALQKQILLQEHLRETLKVCAAPQAEKSSSDAVLFILPWFRSPPLLPPPSPGEGWEGGRRLAEPKFSLFLSLLISVVCFYVGISAENVLADVLFLCRDLSGKCSCVDQC